ncbi:MAG: hypothetical protein JRH11_11485 [Deltaproteobacteria bacterium]|nr:hypothetical protein [Deltaproteobacteria bacterium]
MFSSKHGSALIAAFALALVLVTACGDDTAPRDGGNDTSVGDASTDTGAGDGGDCSTAGETLCGDVCVDLMTDSTNCGGCGAVCGDSFCNMGACDSSCPDDTVVCGVMCCPAAAGCSAAGNSCASPTPACPEEPPVDGATCGDVGYSCVYPRCESEGEVSARCEGSTWDVNTAPCAGSSWSAGRTRAVT